MTSTALVVYTKNFSLRPEAYQPPLFRRITYYAEPVIWRDERSPGRPLGSVVFKEELRTEIINRALRPPPTAESGGGGGGAYNRPKD